jgi:hypothetical protein
MFQANWNKFISILYLYFYIYIFMVFLLINFFNFFFIIKIVYACVSLFLLYSFIQLSKNLKRKKLVWRIF